MGPIRFCFATGITAAVDERFWILANHGESVPGACRNEGMLWCLWVHAGTVDNNRDWHEELMLF